MKSEQQNRLPGKLIDRSIVCRFEFEGRTYEACAGDTIASALAAAGCWVLSRSFKYHRARGLLTMAGQDANTLVQLPSNPNALADMEPVKAKQVIKGQNYYGSLARDRGAIIGKLARFLPVGFYYRAFYRPRGIWNWWAKFFRRAAGLGVIDESFLPDQTYDKQYLFCDLLIVGAGPAGMTAACVAAQAGKKVLLVELAPILGGSLNYSRLDVDGTGATRVCSQLCEKVAAEKNIVVLTNATANGWFSDHWIPVIQGTRLYKVRAARVLLCTGAIEQPSIFRNNDLPGVMMGTAAQRLLSLYGVRPGRQAVILTGNDQGYAVALDLADAGIEVVSIVELRAEVPQHEMALEVSRRGIPVRAGAAVYEAIANSSRDHISKVDVRSIVTPGVCADSGEILSCDLLCMSIGFMPCYQLACQAGARLAYDDESAMFTIDQLPKSMELAGSVNEQWTLEGALDDARRATANLLATCDSSDTQSSFGVPVNRDVDNASQNVSINYPWPVFAHPKGKEFVDFDEDLTIADIKNALQDGYEHVQLVKRFSTCGMGPSQGRLSALAMARIVAKQTDKTVAQTGVTTARPPFAAENLAHCAGRSFFPARKTNMHYRHDELGAQWMHAGLWYRPAYYGRDNNREQIIINEVNQVRENVGLIDVSTLGGIDIRGPDAGLFLDRVYTMLYSTLAVGKARYALLTNEAGVAIDDGVACRFSDDHFYLTATTGGVDGVFRQLLKWQAQWRMNIDIANVTSAFCGVNLAGPNSRKVLEKICTDTDLSSDAFPYMAVRQAHIGSIDARLIRVGFVGELGYEIHVPQHCGEALWDTLMEAGKPLQIQPFGVEAQRVLRLEKGHVIIGQDTDAMSNPMELGMEWALSKKKAFYVGKRTISELKKRPLTRKLAGFVIRDVKHPVPQESHLVIDNDDMVGRVTSASYSPTLGHTIGLAYVPLASSNPGEQIQIRCDNNEMVEAEIVSLPFFDAQNRQQSL